MSLKNSHYLVNWIYIYFQNNFINEIFLINHKIIIFFKKLCISFFKKINKIKPEKFLIKK